MPSKGYFIHDRRFLISARSTRDYAELRISDHLGDFNKTSAPADRVASGIAMSGGEQVFLHDCKNRDRLLADIESRWFAGVEYPVNA